MSIHCLQTVMGDGTAVLVQTGWDETLAGFALIVESNDPREAASRCRFSNLDQLPGVPLEKGYVALHADLARLGITLPRTMLSAILKEANQKAANMRILWSGDGTIEDIRSWD